MATGATVLLLLAVAVAVVVASRRRSGDRTRPSTWVRHDPTATTMTVRRDVPELQALAYLDLLRSHGIAAELVPARGRPPLTPALRALPRYDVHVPTGQVGRARRRWPRRADASTVGA